MVRDPVVSTTPEFDYALNLENFTTFPNPTDGNLSIDLGKNHQTVKVTVTDLRGKFIQSSRYNNSQLLNLNLEEPTGIYLLIIETENQKTVIRLVKE